jgi:hypothetical protein
LAKDRPLDEAKAALAMRILLQHLGAQDIGRHQVGGELHPAGLEARIGLWPGVVSVGLFAIAPATVVLVAGQDGVRRYA